MGFWKKSFRVLQDVTSLGGTYRMRSQAERYDRLFATYESLRTKIANANKNLLGAIERIRKLVKRGTRKLKRADAILAPLKKYKTNHRGEVPNLGTNLIRAENSLSTCQTDRMSTVAPTAVGAAAGVGAAAASWSTVQVAAHASTGTAMLGLHGAAASNAGWAWFGGGSLASGGGGMAAGHFVLPGIGTAVAVAVSATLSHREANRMGKLCDELDGINTQNTLTLAKLDSNLLAAARLEYKLTQEMQVLHDALQQATRKVRTFGWLSHCWRLLRFWLRGFYYTSDEFPVVEKLDAAVCRFTDAFKTV